MTGSLAFLQIISYQTSDLTWVCMTVGSELGIEQFPVNRKLVATTVRWHQCDRFNAGLKFLEQFRCQTDSTIGVVSDGTVNQIEL